MRFRVVRATSVLATVGGAPVTELKANEMVTATGASNGTFMEVTVGDGRIGWVLKEDCIATAIAPPQLLDVAVFVRAAVTTAQAFNATDKLHPWYVSPELLIARASLETGLRTSGPRLPGSDAAGPLLVSSAEWRRFLKNAGALARDYALVDFDHDLHQINGAAWRMHEDAALLSAKRTAAGFGSASDPYVPSFLDLHLAYLIDDIDATDALLAAEADSIDAVRPIEDVLRQKLDASRVAGLMLARQGYFGTTGEKRSVRDAIAKVEEALAAALRRAHELIAEHAPLQLPAVKQGEAPWMEIADGELSKNICEPNSRIVTYFASTDHGPATPTTHWCGAFAAHCLAQSGSIAAAASIPTGAAKASNWNGWSTPLHVGSKQLPRGAVVVFKPGNGSGTSGHVAFFDRYDESGRMLVIGGNQSDCVSSTHMRLQVAYVGWLDLQPETFANQFSGPATAGGRISDRAFDMIIRFEVTNRDVYNKKYRGPIWPGGDSGVTIGIGYDVGHTPKAELQADWRGFLAPDALRALETASGVKRRAARDMLPRLVRVIDVPWDAAVKVFRNSVVPRWIARVEEALPNTGELNSHCLGVLVSLAFNRGANFNKLGDKRVEMRNILAHMQNRDFERIPNELRAMARHWPDLEGLQRRRREEGDQFEEGLRLGRDVPLVARTVPAVSTIGAAGVIAALRPPTHQFLFASEWRPLAVELGVAVPNEASDDEVAMAVIDHIHAAAPRDRLLVGFDAGDPVTDPLSFPSRARDRARLLGAELAIYVEGPGGPTGANWTSDEKARIRRAAESVGVPADLSWSQLLGMWDAGRWREYTLAQLERYRMQGYAAAEIDNLDRVFGDDADGARLIAFLSEYQRLYEVGRLPRLILKNISESRLAALADAISRGRISRAVLAEYHIAEDGSGDPAKQASASARLAIRTLFSRDTKNYRAHGAYELEREFAELANDPRLA